jgi:hypothetical protein
MRTSSPEPRRLDRSQQKLATRDIFPDNQVLDGQYMERSDGTIIYKQPTSGEIFEFFRPKEPNFHKMFKQAVKNTKLLSTPRGQYVSWNPLWIHSYPDPPGK